MTGDRPVEILDDLDVDLISIVADLLASEPVPVTVQEGGPRLGSSVTPEMGPPLRLDGHYLILQPDDIC